MHSNWGNRCLCHFTSKLVSKQPIVNIFAWLVSPFPVMASPQDDWPAQGCHCGPIGRSGPYQVPARGLQFAVRTHACHLRLVAAPPPPLIVSLAARNHACPHACHPNRSKNNCNHFTHALAALLLPSGAVGVPDEYTKQHEVILSSPLGPMLQPMLQQVSNPGGWGPR
jgi:hypothetical protein